MLLTPCLLLAYFPKSSRLLIITFFKLRDQRYKI
jgi:hypothetical protein